MIFVKLGTIKIRAGQKDSNFTIIYLNKYITRNILYNILTIL
jgi:hypothetical protein